MNNHIVIVGGPKTGKSTKAETFGLPVRALDSVIEGDNWHEVSSIGAKWLEEPGPWVIEGTAAARALRKWLRAHPEGKPCDQVCVLTEPHLQLSKGQETMGKGCATVWAEIELELAGRGVMILVPSGDGWEPKIVDPPLVPPTLTLIKEQDAALLEHAQRALNDEALAPSGTPAVVEDLIPLNDEELRSRLRVRGISDDDRRKLTDELVKRYESPVVIAAPAGLSRQQLHDKHVAANRKPHVAGAQARIFSDGRPEPKEFAKDLGSLLDKYFDEKEAARIHYEIMTSGHIPREHC